MFRAGRVLQSLSSTTGRVHRLLRSVRNAWKTNKINIKIKTLYSCWFIRTILWYDRTSLLYIYYVYNILHLHCFCSVIRYCRVTCRVAVHTVSTHARRREPELPSLSTLLYGHNHIPILKSKKKKKGFTVLSAVKIQSRL